MWDRKRETATGKGKKTDDETESDIQIYTDGSASDHGAGWGFAVVLDEMAVAERYR